MPTHVHLYTADIQGDDGSLVVACCPICSSESFQPYNGRAGAQCSRCKSLERGRLLWLAMQKLDLLRPGLRTLHLGPERFLTERLSASSGELYHPCDVDPSRYRVGRMHVFPLDACADLAKLPSACFDLVIHNHVLEHLPCKPDDVLHEMARVMVPGGTMLFSVPFRGARTDEDVSPELSDDDRRARFGQPDHLRVFGTRDFLPFAQKALQAQDLVFRFRDHFSPEELALAAVPPDPDTRLTGYTIFVYHKPSTS